MCSDRAQKLALFATCILIIHLNFFLARRMMATCNQAVVPRGIFDEIFFCFFDFILFFLFFLDFFGFFPIFVIFCRFFPRHFFRKSIENDFWLYYSVNKGGPNEFGQSELGRPIIGLLFNTYS